MKKIIFFYIFTLIIICCNAGISQEINFTIKVERKYEKILDKKNSKSSIKEMNEEIFLVCEINVCKIYENNKIMRSKKIEKKEIYKIRQLLKKLQKKSEKEIFFSTNTETVIQLNNKSFFINYIPIEEEEIFEILSYKNKMLINDEEIQKSIKFIYEIRNSYGSLWIVDCSDECRVLYYSEGNDNVKEWRLDLDISEIEKLKNELLDTIREEYRVDIKSDSYYEMSFDNGKLYNHIYEAKSYVEILKKLIKEDIKILEEKNIK